MPISDKLRRLILSVSHEIIEMAEYDEEFRQLLITDPKAALMEEFGIAVPDDVSLRIHEDTATSAHLVLPPQ